MTSLRRQLTAFASALWCVIDVALNVDLDFQTSTSFDLCRPVGHEAAIFDISSCFTWVTPHKWHRSMQSPITVRFAASAAPCSLCLPWYDFISERIVLPANCSSKSGRLDSERSAQMPPLGRNKRAARLGMNHIDISTSTPRRLPSWNAYTNDINAEPADGPPLQQVVTPAHTHA